MAELTFNSPIRRDKWPRWMIKLHEYLKKIYEIPVSYTHLTLPTT